MAPISGLDSRGVRKEQARNMNERRATRHAVFFAFWEIGNGAQRFGCAIAMAAHEKGNFVEAG